MGSQNSSNNSEEPPDNPVQQSNTSSSFADGNEVESSDDQDNSRALSSEEIRQLLAPLDEREREVLRIRFGLDDVGQGRTLEEAGEHFNVSAEMIRQIEAQAMSKLRHPGAK
jgi:RNA polymerase sigma factor (sigma-70 family)